MAMLVLTRALLRPTTARVEVMRNTADEISARRSGRFPTRLSYKSPF